MSDEVIYKAQEKALMKRPMSSAPLLLIGGGATLLIANLIGFSLLELLAPLLFVSGFGMLLMQPAARMSANQRPTIWSWFAVPGAFFLTTGILIFLMSLVDHFEAFAYAWTLLAASAMAGVMYVRRFNEAHPIHEKGHKFIRTMLFLFAGFGIFFELLVFETLGPWWPLLVVGLGVYLFMKERNEE